MCGVTFTILGCKPAVVLQPTFESIQANVFDISCATSGCHDNLSAMSSLDLSAGNSYANLANTLSTQVPTLYRIDPGFPDSSYLIKKLEGTATVGEQMPKGQPPLSQKDINVIREWIQNIAVGEYYTSW